MSNTYEEMYGVEQAAKRKRELRTEMMVKHQNLEVLPKISFPHKVVMFALTRQGVEFQHEYYVNEYSFDIAFPNCKKVVEINGDYYHKREGNLDEIQQATFRNDMAKRQSIEAAGWKILEIWEHDIRDDLYGTINRILEFIGRSRIVDGADFDFPKCDYCGKPLTYKQTVDGHRYCSVKCCSADRVLPDIVCVCPVCGKEFVRSRSSTRGYCSDACRGIAIGDKIHDRNIEHDYRERVACMIRNSAYNVRRRATHIEFTCPCGKKSWKHKCHAKSKMLYCSHVCYARFKHEYHGTNKCNNPLYDKECNK